MLIFNILCEVYCGYLVGWRMGRRAGSGLAFYFLWPMIDRSQDGMVKTRNDKCLRKYKKFCARRKFRVYFSVELWGLNLCATCGGRTHRAVWETFAGLLRDRISSANIESAVGKWTNRKEARFGSGYLFAWANLFCLWGHGKEERPVVIRAESVISFAATSGPSCLSMCLICVGNVAAL